MKYSWLYLILAIAAVVVFNRFLVPAKNSLVATISLEAYEKPQPVKQGAREVLVAKVYSDYPMNHRDFLVIAAGKEDGVAAGMAVTADGNFLLGQVTEVFDRYSTVRTIFDNDWKISTRIGDSATNALLVSGAEPTLTLIDKKAGVRDGDTVYSASRDFPYGLKIGSVAGLTDSGSASLRQARLDTPYDLNELSEVAVLLK